MRWIVRAAASADALDRGENEVAELERGGGGTERVTRGEEEVRGGILEVLEGAVAGAGTESSTGEVLIGDGGRDIKNEKNKISPLLFLLLLPASSSMSRPEILPNLRQERNSN